MVGLEDGQLIFLVIKFSANINMVSFVCMGYRILWFDNASKQNKAKDWNEQLQEVMAFETVEEFWGLYNK